MAKKKESVVYIAYKLEFDYLGKASVKEGAFDNILGVYETMEAAEAATLEAYADNNLNKYSYTVKNILVTVVEK